MGHFEAVRATDGALRYACTQMYLILIYLSLKNFFIKYFIWNFLFHFLEVFFYIIISVVSFVLAACM